MPSPSTKHIRSLDGATQKLIEEAREASAVAARRSDGLMRFVSRYRELVAMPPPQRERIELGELIGRIRELFAGELGSRVALVVEPPAAPIHMSADRALLEQALINLSATPVRRSMIAPARRSGCAAG